jgi:hypothetical protein
MNDKEVMTHIRHNTPLNKVRAVFSGAVGTAEQSARQRHSQCPIAMRKLEFEGVMRILNHAEQLGIVTINREALLLAPKEVTVEG